MKGIQRGQTTVWAALEQEHATEEKGSQGAKRTAALREAAQGKLTKAHQCRGSASGTGGESGY